MGHYASEMCCQTCMNLKCKCPQKKDDTDSKWIVDPYTYRPMRISDYKQSKAGSSMSETSMNIFLIMSEKFATEEEAKARGQERLREVIATNEDSLARLKTFLI